MNLEVIKKVLVNCKKLDKATSKATKNVKVFEKNARQNAWIVCNVFEKEEKIEKLLKKMGFVEEKGLNNVYWYYHEESNKTIKVSFGHWWNDYYGNYSGQISYSIWDGKHEFHTLRNGEVFYENGIMKTMTSRGVWTGD